MVEDIPLVAGHPVLYATEEEVDFIIRLLLFRMRVYVKRIENMQIYSLAGTHLREKITKWFVYFYIGYQVSDNIMTVSVSIFSQTLKLLHNS